MRRHACDAKLNAAKRYDKEDARDRTLLVVSPTTEIPA